MPQGIGYGKAAKTMAGAAMTPSAAINSAASYLGRRKAEQSTAKQKAARLRAMMKMNMGRPSERD